MLFGQPVRGMVGSRVSAGMTERIARWEREDGRYYIVHLCRDLFGDWMLVQVWGGQMRRSAGRRTRHCTDLNQGLRAFDAIGARRLRRRYRLVEESRY